MPKNPIPLIICHQAIELLLKNTDNPMTQVDIISKLKEQGCFIVESTLTNIKNFNPLLRQGKKVGAKTLAKVAKALKKIMAVEYSYVFDEDSLSFKFDEDININIFPRATIYSSTQETILYHAGGRKSVDYKIQFMEYAPPNSTITELGIRLHSFTTYFDNTADEIFKNRVRKLLAKGINLHCLVMDYREELTKQYFQLRTNARPMEEGKYEEMRSIVNKLRGLRFELNNEGYEGKIELFKYNQFPEYHALVLEDRLLISHYILGIKRGNCPVAEIHKKKAPNLFKKYKRSVNYIKATAERIK